jgi:hypothetical protein
MRSPDDARTVNQRTQRQPVQAPAQAPAHL